MSTKQCPRCDDRCECVSRRKSLVGKDWTKMTWRCRECGLVFTTASRKRIACSAQEDRRFSKVGTV